MQAFQQRIQKAVNCEIVLANLMKYQQVVEGQINTLKFHTEERIGEIIPADHGIIHWIAEYAAQTVNRFRIVKKRSTVRESFHTHRRIA